MPNSVGIVPSSELAPKFKSKNKLGIIGLPSRNNKLAIYGLLTEAK